MSKFWLADAVKAAKKRKRKLRDSEASFFVGDLVGNDEIGFNWEIASISANKPSVVTVLNLETLEFRALDTDVDAVSVKKEEE